jgi:hypothetical protein
MKICRYLHCSDIKNIVVSVHLKRPVIEFAACELFYQICVGNN